MKKIILPISDTVLIESYQTLKSVHKIAKKFSTSRQAVTRRLKELKVLRSREQAMSERVFTKRTVIISAEQKKILSEVAKKRIGSKNPFYGKTHSSETKAKLSAAAKTRTKERNPNYKTGEYLRRPRDYKIAEFTKIRNDVFNRDNYKCCYCSNKGHLHAHHILPFWVCKEAFLDKENLITVCSDCHFAKAHKGNWQKFDTDIVTENLLSKYNLQRERLNELTSKNKNEEAIVRPDAIDKTSEVDGNTLPLLKEE
jgi:NUMOD3 motif